MSSKARASRIAQMSIAIVSAGLILMAAAGLMPQPQSTATERGELSAAAGGVMFFPTSPPRGGGVPTRAPELFTPTEVPTAVATPRLGGSGNPRCPLIDLPTGWHVSAACNFNQSETQAAGPMSCQIKRNSCQFSRLVRNRDPRIRFYNEEPAPLNDEDALMHPAMLAPVSRLADLVDAEWGGAIKLYVTDTYDSYGDHDLAQPDLARKYSLHFEGLSIDFVTFPVEPARYPRLCAMAVQAGFDWVHNEADHCHASLRAPTLCTACGP